MKTISRAKDQAVLIGGDALVSVMAFDAATVRLGVRCRGDWHVEQVELTALKRRGDGPPETVETPDAAAPDCGEGDRRTRFFTLPVHGLLRIGPEIRLQVQQIAARVAVLAIDGVPTERIEEV